MKAMNARELYELTNLKQNCLAMSLSSYSVSVRWFSQSFMSLAIFVYTEETMVHHTQKTTRDRPDHTAHTHSTHGAEYHHTDKDSTESVGQLGELGAGSWGRGEGRVGSLDLCS